MAEDVFDRYVFEKNVFGDIIAIYDIGGNQLGTYTYDAWGNVTVSGTSSMLTMNPFRYRGYYYDTETGFYYLQSRYYSPRWGRFINADAYLNANGDMFATYVEVSLYGSNWAYTGGKICLGAFQQSA